MINWFIDSIDKIYQMFKSIKMKLQGNIRCKHCGVWRAKWFYEQYGCAIPLCKGSRRRNKIRK